MEYQLSELKADHTEVAAELEVRTAKEEKLKKAKQILLPSEGQVLFNAANDIILRLSGLSFDVNKSDIKDEHAPLLEKVKTVLEMFDDAKLVVEGHTDASGEASVNLALSEKRAFSVMQYLRQSLLISADRISAIGYGSEKPIASNKTSEGRAKNRRIDIIIMQ
jgi:outer membrane protein OmpA-like peptidoglycan-associated protein